MVNPVTAARRTLALVAAVAALAAVPTRALAAPAYDWEAIDAAAALYRSEWQTGLGLPTGWNGSTADCAAGTVSEEYQAAVLRAINYARTLMGIGPVALDPSASAKAQAVAVNMAANGTISHTPQTTDPADPATYAPRCFTGETARGAAQSLLYLDTTPGQAFSRQMGAANAVGAYLDDWGAGNEGVGHRIWLATANLLAVGVGATPSSNAIAFHQAEADGGAPLYQWTADWQETMWPSSGLFPCELLPMSGRWSYHVSDGGTWYGARSVTVTSRGAVLLDHAPASYQSDGGEFLPGQTLNMYPSRIVWEMPPLVCPAGPYDVDTYQVTLHGGPQGDVTYEVGVFAATAAEPGVTPAGDAWTFAPGLV
jgi:hypothetical protein